MVSSRVLLDQMMEGFALHEVIVDEDGTVTDYRFLQVNSAFEHFTGLRAEDVCGRTAREVLPEIEGVWLARYGAVASTGEPDTFVQHTETLGRTFEVRAYSPAPGMFATIFFDVTDRVRAHDRLERMARSLKALSSANKALVRACEEMQFLGDVCDLLVDTGGFDAVVVAHPECAGGTLLPAASRVAVPGVTARLDVAGSTPEAELCRRALAGGKPTCDSLAAGGVGALRAVCAIPLVASTGAELGVLCVASAHGPSFDETEADLVFELAADLAHGVHHLRCEALRREAERDLKQANRRLERVIHEIADVTGRLVELRDPYTQGHQQRVAGLATLIAGELDYSEDDVLAVGVAAVLHDVGKLAVPAEILTKPARLSPTEYLLVQEHSRAGYDALCRVEFGWPVAEIVLQHHERLDGSGYPAGLVADEIHPLARVIAVADVIDAMASHRPYRPALGIDQALAELEARPDLYDRTVVDAACRLHLRGALGEALVLSGSRSS